MGLDQYLLIKTKTPTKKQAGDITGACGGLIPVAPTSDKTEIGYWRKFYKLEELIQETKKMSEDEYDKLNCQDIKLSKKNLEFIRDYANEEIAELEDWYNGDIDKLEDSEDGWDYCHWLKTKEIMDSALRILDRDSDAEVYYKYWR